MKWTNSYRSFGLKTKRSTGLKTIEHKQMSPAVLHATCRKPLTVFLLATVISHVHSSA